MAGARRREVMSLSSYTQADLPTSIHAIHQPQDIGGQPDEGLAEVGMLQFKLKTASEMLKEVPTAPTGEATATAPFTNSKPIDLLIRLPSVELVDLRAKPSGFFATLAIGEEAKALIDKFVDAAQLLVDGAFKGRAQHAFASPFSDPQPHEAAAGIVARVDVKISEYANRLTNSLFSTPSAERLFGPGDSVVEMHAALPRGSCAVTLHLMGAWYDKTKTGPLMYLSAMAFDSDTPRSKMPRTNSAMSMALSSGSTPATTPPWVRQNRSDKSYENTPTTPTGDRCTSASSRHSRSSSRLSSARTVLFDSEDSMRGDSTDGKRQSGLRKKLWYSEFEEASEVAGKALAVDVLKKALVHLDTPEVSEWVQRMGSQGPPEWLNQLVDGEE